MRKQTSFMDVPLTDIDMGGFEHLGRAGEGRWWCVSMTVHRSSVGVLDETTTTTTSLILD